MIATALIILTQSIYLLVKIWVSSEHDMFSTKTILEVAKIVILAVCILIVAIPEGLPLAVSIAMALSINKLKND